MSITVAITGNPGSRDFMLYNILTGTPEFSENMIIDTGKKMSASFKDDQDVLIEKLPGTYSLSGYTYEERTLRNCLLKERPNALINVIDHSVIKRSLYLTTQLLEFSIPSLIVLNNTPKGTDTTKLGDSLGVPVLPFSRFSEEDISGIENWMMGLKMENHGTLGILRFQPEIEEVLSGINAIAQREDPDSIIPDYLRRFYTIKFFERDGYAVADHPNSKEITKKVEELIVQCEESFDDEAENIITGQRYDKIMELLACNG